MADYVATFYTQLSALLTCRALSNAGVSARLAPTPRAVSSNCGACVMYSSDGPHFPLMDTDAEEVYEVRGGGFVPLGLDKNRRTE